MWLWIIAGIVAVLVGGFAWGVVRLRRGQSQAQEAIASVKIEEIAGLCEECVEGFKEHFGETLDLHAFEESAQTFSARLDNHESLKEPFSIDTFYWRFVLNTGAFLGEMLRVHAGGEWSYDDDGGAPVMKITVGEGKVTVFPFDKILKHVQIGDPGDMYAFLQTSLKLEEVVAGASET